MSVSRELLHGLSTRRGEPAAPLLEPPAKRFAVNRSRMRDLEQAQALQVLFPLCHPPRFR